MFRYMIMIHAGPNVTINRMEMSCGRTKMPPKTNNSDYGQLGPTSARENIHYEHLNEEKLLCSIRFFIFLLRWNFYPATNDF